MKRDQGMQEHMQQMRQMHQQLLWVHFTVMLLGVWLICSPFTFGSLEPANFGPGVERVTTDRMLAPPEQRAQWLMWSDIASGALLVLFGGLSLFWRWRAAQWGTCGVGVWLLFAPLVFWVPDAATYANETVVGALAIALSVLIPMMPGMSMESMMAGEDIPPGWDYSPSSWSQRLPIVALALVGFFVARYLSAYQLGHIGSVWDPFFGDGTERIITSDVSRAWPVADAGLGAISYMLEALSGLMGDRRRWRTMPWMVGMFGVLVIPLGGVSIYFIVIQPIVIGTWCTLCLISAAAMVIMLPYSFDEIAAMFQFMLRARREGQSMWRVFWRGGNCRGARASGEPPLALDAEHARQAWRQFGALPKGLAACTVLGVWLMCTRLIFGSEEAMADSDHLVGAMVIVVSVSAFSEVVRPLRALNTLLGAWLVAAPWLLPGANSVAAAGSVAAGLLLIFLSIPRGPVRHHYAGWDRYLVW
ncbi:vitamin K epoxide reductase family protein [Schlegelella sp. S2-27]|uniref:Vitamin K epoxide reductase family protein n=1 Tax=Caldimonas mangrovi TaxID=2944811 RepID=A0ABT0YR99_9BURK|nr:vitamin K epoxide reductase family protein [Caldimonas mangrovi]MCM5681249.1 vitamin K epoxide reductase family protein [Caldimonas mangrovi]